MTKHYCGYERLKGGWACRAVVRELGQRCGRHTPEALAYAEARHRLTQDEETFRTRMVLRRRLASREAQLRALTSEVEHLKKQLSALEPAEVARTPSPSNGAPAQRGAEVPS